MPEVVGVQYLKGGGVYYFLTPKEKLALDAFCVVEGEHGLQMARVVRATQTWDEERVPKNLKPIARIASGRDHEQLKKNNKKEREAYRLCRQKVKQKNMQMKLVDVSYTLDGRKAIFYFTAENRVDFRELVKELAQALKIKIEMRQIGVRDEARRLGGVGCCGRTLCCASFLKDFASVSIRMAKEQNLSLNPSKVSGLCGRLMCCLAYEYEGGSGRGKKKKGEQKNNGANQAQAKETACAGCDKECIAEKATGEAATPVKPVEVKTSGPAMQPRQQPQPQPQPKPQVQQKQGEGTQDKNGEPGNNEQSRSNKRRNNFRRNRGHHGQKKSNRRR